MLCKHLISSNIKCFQMALKRFLEKKQIEPIESFKHCCTLKSTNSNLPNIILHEKAVHIGRSEQSTIKDLSCSKKQLLVKADFINRVLCIKVCGINPSGLNGFLINPGKIYEAHNGDIIELIYGHHQYRVAFASSPVKNESKEVDTKKFTALEGTWDSLDDGKLLVYTPSNNKFSEKVAAYDLDWTLIGTISGRVFPKDAADWKILYPEIPNKLKSLFNMNFKIVIFTNQSGIAKGKISVADFKHKITTIISKLGVPIQLFASIGEGVNRKPLPGMWKYLQEKCNNGIKISSEKSFYIGDAAGRVAISSKIKKDFSCTDRLFALNIGIPFMTPEEHFLNQKPREFNMPIFNPKQINHKVWFNSEVVVPAKETEVILLVGLPGSGKSFFGRKVLAPLGYSIINRDTMKSMDACLEMCRKNLKERKSSVIDNTNVDIESRKRFVDIAKNMSVKIRCFVMTTTAEHVKHNIVFRHLTECSTAKINDMILNSFKKKFVDPSEKEGFSQIVKVNFVPTFKNPEEENLYKMYLTEK